MILDKFENRQFYYPLNPKIKQAFDFLAQNNWKILSAGKYEFDENIFGNLQEYVTHPENESEYEVHRKYIDIQYMISGEEIMATGNLDNFKVTKEYNEERDVAFGTCTNTTKLLVNEGYFTIFTPIDAHKPCLISDTAKNVKKIIVKIKI